MVAFMQSTQKLDSSVLLQELRLNQIKMPLFLLKRTQSLQTVLLQKMAMFGGKELVILQKENLLTGKEIHVMLFQKTNLQKVKNLHIQMHALQLLQDSVHVSLLNGNPQKVYQFLLFCLVDVVLQLYLLYIRLVLGNTVYSLVLS